MEIRGLIFRNFLSRVWYKECRVAETRSRLPRTRAFNIKLLFIKWLLAAATLRIAEIVSS
jgi:hypothetical protein